jgi:hypothetical protein
MQSGSAVLVLQMQIGATVEKASDSFHLPFGIPGRTSDGAIRGIMKGAAVAVIACRIWVGAGP